MYLNKERFNTIYLSSNLGYILDTYGEAGEFSGLLLDDIFCAFTRYYEPLENDKEKKISKIIDAISKKRHSNYWRGIVLSFRFY